MKIGTYESSILVQPFLDTTLNIPHRYCAQLRKINLLASPAATLDDDRPGFVMSSWNPNGPTGYPFSIAADKTLLPSLQEIRVDVLVGYNGSEIMDFRLSPLFYKSLMTRAMNILVSNLQSLKYGSRKPDDSCDLPLVKLHYWQAFKVDRGHLGPYRWPVSGLDQSLIVGDLWEVISDSRIFPSLCANHSDANQTQSRWPARLLCSVSHPMGRSRQELRRLLERCWKIVT